METEQFQQKSGTHLTSEQAERIANDPLAGTIVSMMKAMSVDYGRVFSKQFHNDETVTQFKRRLYRKLKGISLEAIVDGYELCTERNTHFCPTVPEIVCAALEAAKAHKLRDKNKAEAERVSALPPPTITCNPIQMLRDAIAAAGNRHNEQDEVRLARKAKMWDDHQALLKLHRNKITQIYPSHEHNCSYGGCDKAGSISRGTTGNGNYYCASHFRRA